MSSMQGNPHVEAAERLSGDSRIAEAMMALAFEQRTANLIALLNAGYTSVQIGGVDYDTLANQIVARLQPEGK